MDENRIVIRKIPKLSAYDLKDNSIKFLNLDIAILNEYEHSVIDAFIDMNCISDEGNTYNAITKIDNLKVEDVNNYILNCDKINQAIVNTYNNLIISLLNNNLFPISDIPIQYSANIIVNDSLYIARSNRVTINNKYIILDEIIYMNTDNKDNIYKMTLELKIKDTTYHININNKDIICSEILQPQLSVLDENPNIDNMDILSDKIFNSKLKCCKIYLSGSDKIKIKKVNEKDIPDTRLKALNESTHNINYCNKPSLNRIKYIYYNNTLEDIDRLTREAKNSIYRPININRVILNTFKRR